MRLEHHIFLTLVITAAIVTGSTLGVAANFPYILNQTEKSQSQQMIVQGQPAEAVKADTEANSPATSAIYGGSPVSSADVMVITSAEKKQIIEMLKSLGMTDEADLSAFIKGFQQKHALDATGLLDSKTLHFIMEEAKLLKVDNITRQASLN